MSTPTATPRTQALWMKHYAFCNEDEATEAICDFRDHGNALETELAAAKAECERLKADGAASSFVDMSVRASNAETELARLRAEVERLKDGGVQRIKDALATALDTRDAAIARAERAEAALAARDAEYMRGGKMLAESAAGWQARAERAEASLHDLSLDLSTANHMIKLERDRADALQTRLKEIESALRKFNLID